MRSAVHKRSHLAQVVRTQIIERQKAVCISDLEEMEALCDIDGKVIWRLKATLNTILRDGM